MKKAKVIDKTLVLVMASELHPLGVVFGLVFDKMKQTMMIGYLVSKNFSFSNRGRH